MGRKVGIWGGAALLSLVFASSASAATFEARGSVEQVYATGLPAGVQISLLNSSNGVVATRNANELGGALFRNVTPGDGYQVRRNSTSETVGPLTVLTTQSAPLNTAIYNQTVEADGYGYMTMRDGVKLAYATHPPSDILAVLATAGIPIPPGLTDLFNLIPSVLNQTPTLIEYSGYGTADPDGPESGISIIANLMGFSVVDVNMRGTGCSGGAYDFFEPLQGLDGYDIIETVARQPWVKGDKVGMFGISFGGISQLFTAQYQPPSLAAISPLSVIDQTQTTLYPGGVLNTGFAYSWAVDRVHDARPAPDGQPWANDQIAAEGTGGTCQANQALHPEASDLLQKIDENDHYVPEVADPLSPKTFVDKINVPTFLACQWTDEQTGGHCPTLASRLTGTDKKWVTFTNGTHVDSLKPETLSRLYSFLQIYVDQAAPAPKAALVNAAMPVLYQEAMGITGVTPPLPPDPIMVNPDYNSAKAAWEAQKPIRIEYDNGAGGSTPGHPYSGFTRDYDSFMAPGTTSRSWYLGDDGALQDAPAATAAADGFAYDGANAAATNFSGSTGTGTDGLWTDTPPYHWNQDPAGTAVAYVTEPLASDTTVLGSGAVDLWVRSSKPNIDLEVIVSEVRPDLKETYVQGGWMRGDARELDPAKSTALEPVLSLRESDAKPLPADSFVKATVPLYYQGHVYREGSRIRIRVSAPGGDQPVWSFAESPNITADVEIGRGPNLPSRLLLPVTDAGVDAPDALPSCVESATPPVHESALRGQPCRPYVEFENAAGGPVPKDPPGGHGGTQDGGRCATFKRGDARKNLLKGTRFGDRLLGRAANDRLIGGGGDDCLFGQRGLDTLKGNRGRDSLKGGPGRDRITGGRGRDTIKGGGRFDRIFANDGFRDRVLCGRGRDVVKADPKDRLFGCERVIRKVRG